MKMKFLTIFILFGNASAIFADECASKLDFYPAHGYPQKFRESLCAAKKAMVAKDFSAAIEYYEIADKMSLHEFPNFEVLPKLAIAFCASNQKDKGKIAADTFECSLSIYEGKKRCYSGIVDAEGMPILNKEIPDQCAMRMCGEVYESYYRNHDKKSLRRIAIMRQELLDAQKICKGP